MPESEDHLARIFRTLHTLCLRDFQVHDRTFILIISSVSLLQSLELHSGSYPCCVLQHLKLQKIKVLKLSSIKICLKCLKYLMVTHAQTLKVVELKHLSLKDVPRPGVIPLGLLRFMRCKMQLESFTMCFLNPPARLAKV